jgi:hypothetical protein
MRALAFGEQREPHAEDPLADQNYDQEIENLRALRLGITPRTIPTSASHDRAPVVRGAPYGSGDPLADAVSEYDMRVAAVRKASKSEPIRVDSSAIDDADDPLHGHDYDREVRELRTAKEARCDGSD